MSNNTTCDPKSYEATPEQVNYANILFWGSWGGIFLMIVTYVIYLAGIMEPHVDPNLVVTTWGKGVDEYMHITNSPHGWGWVALLGTGDFLNFLGLALLAGLTIGCYFTLIPGYLRCKDYKYAFIVIAEIIVLSVAASGILGSGGH